MHYTIGSYRLRSEKDVVFINNKSDAWMVKKPEGFDDRLANLFKRPADSRGDLKQIFCELFGVCPVEPEPLQIDPTVFDG